MSWQGRIIVSNSKLINTRSVSTVKYNFADYYFLNQYFISVDWLALFSSTMCNDIEGLWRLFNEAISASIIKYVPKGCNKQRNNGHSYPMCIKRALNKKVSLWYKRFSPAGRVAYK